MSTSHPRFTAQIEGPPQTIFDLLADIPNYARWLSGSDAFGGTTQVSPDPVQLGTTYLDAGPAGQRTGSVTPYAFHHTMLLKKGPLTANIDVNIRYTLQPVDSATWVIRDLDLVIQIPGLMKLADPFVVYVFRKGNLRILGAETLRRSATETSKSQLVLVESRALVTLLD